MSLFCGLDVFKKKFIHSLDMYIIEVFCVYLKSRRMSLNSLKLSTHKTLKLIQTGALLKPKMFCLLKFGF